MKVGEGLVVLCSFRGGGVAELCCRFRLVENGTGSSYGLAKRWKRGVGMVFMVGAVGSYSKRFHLFPYRTRGGVVWGLRMFLCAVCSLDVWFQSHEKGNTANLVFSIRRGGVEGRDKIVSFIVLLFCAPFWFSSLYHCKVRLERAVLRSWFVSGLVERLLNCCGVQGWS